MYIRTAQLERAVVVRAHNISVEGVAVSAAEGLPQEGEEVECRLTLAGQRRNLRGRVAWVRPRSSEAPARPGLPSGGIHFFSLGDEDRGLLERLVQDASDAPQVVEVWLPGVEHPLRMRALIGSEELTVGMRLPRVEVGGAVRVAFVHRGVSEVRSGTIGAIRFVADEGDSLSRVALQVSTPRARAGAGEISGGAPDRRHSPTEADEHSVMLDVAALAAPEPPREPAFPRPAGTVAAGPGRRWVSWLLAGAAGAVIGGIVVGTMVSRPPATARSQAHEASPAAASTSRRVTIEPLPSANPR